MRTTIKNLQNVVDRINRDLGTPDTPYRQIDENHFEANVGNYHLSQAYGGVALHKMANTSGAAEDVFRSGHVSNANLYGLLHAFIAGYTTQK